MNDMKQDREVYPNAPVVLVAVEARHPGGPLLNAGEQSEIKRLLGAVFPLPQPFQSRTLTAMAGGQATVLDEQVPRFATRDQTTAVTYNAESVVLETTSHRNFEHLAELLEVVLVARQQAAPVAGLLRLGLRYIDEVRVPDLADGPAAWSEWVSSTLLGPAEIGASHGLVAQQWQGVMVFDRGEGRQVLVRYGPREGFAVMPGGLLQRPTPPPGTFFLLDIDSFWTPTAEVPEFSAEFIVQLCADLHEPVSGLFESLITEKLREEVLRNV